MPLPLAWGAVSQASKLLRGISKRFGPPSGARAATAGAAMLAAANAGNLTAAFAILQRRYIGVSSGKAVWQALAAQLRPQIAAAALAHPQVGKAATAYDKHPLIDHTSEASAAQTSLANAVMYAPSRSSPTPLRDRASAGAPTGTGGALSHEEMTALGKAGRKDAGYSNAKVSRYDPDTGRKRRVWIDSTEANTWSRRKPFTATVGGRRTIAAASRAVTAAGVPASLAFVAAVKAAGAAAGLGLGATLGVVAGGFAVGFLIGTAINKLAARLAPDEIGRRKALAFRAARAAFAEHAGRAMTPAEVRQMGAGFLETLSAATRRRIGR